MRNILYGILTLVGASADLRCKAYIEENFRQGEEKEICQGKVLLRKKYNKGMALNIASDYPEEVKKVSGVACGVIGIYSVIVWIKSKCPWKKLGASLTLAGAISNTYDRFVRGYVVDFFSFKTKSDKVNKLTFNLGDIFIFLGSAIWFVAELAGCKKKKVEEVEIDIDVTE